jgi:holin-like protein
MRKSALALAAAMPGLALCCALALLGDGAARALNLPLPGAVIGLIVYLAWAGLNRGIGWAAPGAGLLRRWLGAMVVPALVSVSGALPAGRALLPVLALLVITTLATALATAGIYRLARGRG